MSWLTGSVRVVAIGTGALLVFGLIQFLIGLFSLWRLKSKSRRVTSPSIIQLADSLSRKIGCDRRIEIYRCPELSTAATVGSFTPHIFIADDFEEWDLESQESVLAHEIAHIHHRDFETNVLAQLCRVIHFFNPIVHAFAKQLRLQQELAADRVAAEATIGAASYSRILASLALRQDSASPQLASMFLPEESNFIQRIKMLKRKPAKPNRSAAWLAPLVAVVVAISVCGIRLPANAFAEPVVAVQDKEKDKSGFDLSWTHPMGSVTCMKMSDLLDSPLLSQMIEKSSRFKGFADINSKQHEAATGLGTSQVDEVIICSMDDRVQSSYTIYRTFEDNLENFKTRGEVVGQADSFPIEMLRKSDLTGYKHGLILDERTVLYTYDPKIVDKVKSLGKTAYLQAKWLKDFKKVADRQLVLSLIHI